jgi:hypothetical protein
VTRCSSAAPGQASRTAAEPRPWGSGAVAFAAVKYLLWQFSAYAAVALALGVVMGRWSMAGRVAQAERERQRAAYELSSLTMKASALLEASGRERSSIVDANGRLAEDLRSAREAQARIEMDLRTAELTRAKAEVSLRAVAEDPTRSSTDPDGAERDAEADRLRDEVRAVRQELARVVAAASIAVALSEARAKAAEDARLELSRLHAASVRAAQAELTLAVLRAERAEGGGGGPAAASPKDTDRIVDLRPFERTAGSFADRGTE